MVRKYKIRPPALKLKVALEAVHNQKTVNQIASEHEQLRYANGQIAGELGETRQRLASTLDELANTRAELAMVNGDTTTAQANRPPISLRRGRGRGGY